MAAHRPTLYGTQHAVSAGHYLASMAGFSILEAGGNAIDAGCAAGMSLGVLQPDLVNFAGVAPIILRMADGTVETIAGLGHWPKKLPADLFMCAHGGNIPNGLLRTVVPAARGHGVKDWPEWTWLAGSVEAIRTDPKTGLVAAGADPRRPAYAAAI